MTDPRLGLKGLRWTGDLSLEDAAVLAYLARNHHRILEFGAGGSTQIFAQVTPGQVWSYETDSAWQTTTESRLQTLAKTVTWLGPGDPLPDHVDLIFVDGRDDLRRDWAIKAWPTLASGGVMAFHDTRRFQDFQNLAWVAQLFYTEINHILVNTAAQTGNHSNISLIYKRPRLDYVNWNHTEGKPQWAYGDLDPTRPLWEA